jgi:hypothetical protein
MSVQDMASFGGYRIRGYGWDHVLRDDSDLANGTVAVSIPELTKHAACLLANAAPLMAYDEETGSLSVPLGADLPPMYARAAVLSSGRPPHKEGGNLIYPSVPGDLAGHLYALLKS